MRARSGGAGHPPFPPRSVPDTSSYTHRMADDGGVPGDVARVLQRSVQLLRCFTYDDGTLSTQQLVERSGLPRSAVYRNVGDLVRLGLLTRTPSGRIAIGSLVWELGQLSHIQLRLRATAQVHLTRLYDLTGENVLLAVMTTDVPETAEVMYVGHVMGPHSVHTLAHEGGRFPLHATAIGKALVSAQSPAWIDRFLARAMSQETRRTIVDPAALRHEIATARARGYATQTEEMSLGAAALAAPIPSGGDTPAAAVVVATAVEGWDERRLAHLVRLTAQALAKDMRGEA